MPIQTPICDFGKKAVPFELKSIDGKILKLDEIKGENGTCLLYTSPSPRDRTRSRMPSSA